MRVGQARKLARFLTRERRLIRERRSELGIRRALGERLRSTFELAGRDELASGRAAVEAHAHAVAPIPDMGRALEGLAARIDALDAAVGHLAPRGPASALVRPSAGAALLEAVAALPDRPLRRSSGPIEFVPGRLRVLGVNDMYPLISETYIRGELASLIPFGADLAWCRLLAPLAPSPVPEPVFDELDRAIEHFRPDLCFVHFLDVARARIPDFERHGMPFGVRSHSSDFDPEELSALLAHPLCVGGWTYPAEGFSVEGAHELAPMLDGRDFEGPVGPREAIVSVSGGLPKKDWPMLLDAFDRLGEGDRRLVVGLTHTDDDVPGGLARACQLLERPPLLQLNLTRDQVLALLARTTAAIYTLVPQARFGMPMSIAEALCSGCSVIVPDRPEALAYAGPDARSYRTAADIARHARTVLEGGPEIDGEQARNRDYGRRRFCDPQMAAGFDAQLRAGLERVRAALP